MQNNILERLGAQDPSQIENVPDNNKVLQNG